MFGVSFIVNNFGFLLCFGYQFGYGMICLCMNMLGCFVIMSDLVCGFMFMFCLYMGIGGVKVGRWQVGLFQMYVDYLKVQCLIFVDG